jgi:aryl-alcohol dehydrogenase-like predicted oxidoreductase
MNFVEANGAKIPAIGLGTMTLMDAVCVEAVETALCVGYRHIDTAERYRNESEVGEGLRRGLRAAHVEREDVFVTTKVWRDQLAAADFERSLEIKASKSWSSPGSIFSSSIGQIRKCCSRRRSTFCARLNAMAEPNMSESRISPQPCCRRPLSLQANRW